MKIEWFYVAWMEHQTG